MRTASSARRTWRASASASEYTATVATPAARGRDDAAGDLAAVGDQDLLEHPYLPDSCAVPRERHAIRPDGAAFLEEGARPSRASVVARNVAIRRAVSSISTSSIGLLADRADQVGRSRLAARACPRASATTISLNLRVQFLGRHDFVHQADSRARAALNRSAVRKYAVRPAARRWRGPRTVRSSPERGRASLRKSRTAACVEATRCRRRRPAPCRRRARRPAHARSSELRTVRSCGNRSREPARVSDDCPRALLSPCRRIQLRSAPAQKALARAGEHDDADIRGPHRPPRTPRELGDQRLVEGVAHLGPVHPDPARRSAPLDVSVLDSVMVMLTSGRRRTRVGDRRVQRRGEGEAKHAAGVRRVDDAVVPQPRGGVVRMALRLVLRRGSAP